MQKCTDSVSSGKQWRTAAASFFSLNISSKAMLLCTFDQALNQAHLGIRFDFLHCIVFLSDWCMRAISPQKGPHETKQLIREEKIAVKQSAAEKRRKGTS